MLAAFASSKLSRRTTKLHEKGHIARIFEKWGYMPPGPPVPTSMVRELSIELERGYEKGSFEKTNEGKELGKRYGGHKIEK